MISTALTAYLDTLGVSVEATQVPNNPTMPNWTGSTAWDVVLHKGNARVNVDFLTGSAVSSVTRYDVLYALMSDNNTILDYENFDRWANSLGYNSDSINDKKIYDLCVANAEKLNTLFNERELIVLDELYTDY